MSFRCRRRNQQGDRENAGDRRQNLRWGKGRGTSGKSKKKTGRGTKSPDTGEEEVRSHNGVALTGEGQDSRRAIRLESSSKSGGEEKGSRPQKKDTWGGKEKKTAKKT